MKTTEWLVRDSTNKTNVFHGTRKECLQWIKDKGSDKYTILDYIEYSIN